MASGFRNPHCHTEHGFIDLLRWQWQRLRRQRPRHSADPDFTLARNDPNFLRGNVHETTLTWIGHSTLLLQCAGTNLLTDPHLSERASPLSWAGPKRHTPPGLGPHDLPPIHWVLLSHNHYDHLDLPTLRWLNRQPGDPPPRIIAPLGLGKFLTERGLRDVVELDWWEQTSFRDWTVQAVPVQHFSARTPLDRNKTLWAGYVVEHSSLRFFFAGDTGYSADFHLIGQKLGPMDLAAIPIGAYAPRWFMRTVHVNPEEALKIHRDVRARCSVAIHWGTFSLTDEPLDEPPRRLRAALVREGIPKDTFLTMQHGETRRLDAGQWRPLKG